MRRTKFIIFIFGLVLIILGYFIEKQNSTVEKTLSINSATISLELATTEAQQEQGLSGRDSLLENTGMLFVFDKPNMVGFWMKDMKFALDMMWFDKDLKVITIKENVASSTYPTTFYPDKEASYTLEVPAGFASTYGIKVGDQGIIKTYEKN